MTRDNHDYDESTLHESQAGCPCGDPANAPCEICTKYRAHRDRWRAWNLAAAGHRITCNQHGAAYLNRNTFVAAGHGNLSASSATITQEPS